MSTSRRSRRHRAPRRRGGDGDGRTGAQAGMRRARRQLRRLREPRRDLGDRAGSDRQAPPLGIDRGRRKAAARFPGPMADRRRRPMARSPEAWPARPRARSTWPRPSPSRPTTLSRAAWATPSVAKWSTSKLSRSLRRVLAEHVPLAVVLGVANRVGSRRATSGAVITMRRARRPPTSWRLASARSSRRPAQKVKRSPPAGVSVRPRTFTVNAFEVAADAVVGRRRARRRRAHGESPPRDRPRRPRSHG